MAGRGGSAGGQIGDYGLKSSRFRVIGFEGLQEELNDITEIYGSLPSHFLANLLLF
jgi:hypothetical protein